MSSDRYQVIVIGAGPAGLMAAGQAAEQGARTLLLERMPRPARKLRISGKGRGNVTNTAPLRQFIDHFNEGRFLYNAFARFFNTDLRAFLDQIGVPTLSERGGRVFPQSDRAQDVVDALVRWVHRRGVVVMTEMRAQALLVEKGRVIGVQAARERPGEGAAQQTYYGSSVIVATGGASYPATGSTGDGYRLAESVGHTIVPIRPALVPLVTAGDVAPRLQGLSLRNVQVTALADGEPLAEAFGEMLFTHNGVSGPIILSISRPIVDALRQGQDVTLSIDLKPALDLQKLDARLLRDLDTYGKRHYRTLLKGLLPSSLIPICIEQTGVPADRVAHQVTAEERGRLHAWLKGFCLAVVGYGDWDEAIVTAGGLDRDELDPRTMASRLVPGLYFAGEVIDIDAQTGGYNLQAAFSTGWVAGRAAAAETMEQDIDDDE